MDQGTSPDLSALIAQLMGGSSGSTASSNQNALQPAYLPTPVQIQPTLFSGAQMNPAATVDPSQLPQVNAPQVNAQQINPNQLQKVNAQQIDSSQFSPNSAIAQLMSSFAPQATRSTNALNDQLAAAGIVGGAGVNAQNELQGQLASSLGSAIAPLIQNSNQQMLSAQQANQGSNLTGQQANLGALMQTLLGNQSANLSGQQTNASTGLSGQQSNLSALMNVLMGNQGALNTANYQQAGLTQQAGLSNQNASNNAAYTNAGAYNATDATNVGSYNSAQQALFNSIMQQYQNQQNQFGAINSGAQSGSNQQAVNYGNSYQIPTGAAAGASAFGTALGQSLYKPPNTTTPAIPSTTSAPTQTGWQSGEAGAGYGV
jgi:hypothetical protein